MLPAVLSSSGTSTKEVMYFDDVKECFKTELLCTEMNYFEMRFGHWTVWRIFFLTFVICRLYFISIRSLSLMEI